MSVKIQSGENNCIVFDTNKFNIKNCYCKLEGGNHKEARVKGKLKHGDDKRGGGGEEFLSKTRIHTPQEKAYLL